LLHTASTTASEKLSPVAVVPNRLGICTSRLWPAGSCAILGLAMVAVKWRRGENSGIEG
jgi:hypothetical protein